MEGAAAEENHRLILIQIPDETQHPARRWMAELTFSWLAMRRSIAPAGPRQRLTARTPIIRLC